MLSTILGNMWMNVERPVTKPVIIVVLFTHCTYLFLLYISYLINLLMYIFDHGNCCWPLHCRLCLHACLLLITSPTLMPTCCQNNKQGFPHHYNIWVQHQTVFTNFYFCFCCVGVILFMLYLFRIFKIFFPFYNTTFIIIIMSLAQNGLKMTII